MQVWKKHQDSVVALLSPRPACPKGVPPRRPEASSCPSPACRRLSLKQDVGGFQQGDKAPTGRSLQTWGLCLKCLVSLHLEDIFPVIS